MWGNYFKIFIKKFFIKDPNACIHLISKALTGRKAVTANVFSLLNEHFECNGGFILNSN